MRFLFYLEPFIERQRPFWKEGWLEFALPMRQSLMEAGHEFRILIGEALVDAALKRGLSADDLIIADYQPFVGRVGKDYLDITSRWYRGERGAVVDEFAAYVKSIAGGYVPEVAISLSPAPFVPLAFPGCKLLHMEVGMFSRRPFPLTLYFDSCGMFGGSALCVRGDEINAFRADQDELAFIAGLRERYLTGGLERLLPTARAIYGDRIAGFRASVLLPLQFSGYYGFDANCEFASQFDYLCHVLQRVPADIAVVVTEHPENPAVTDEIAQYLSARHPNFIWDERGRRIYASSQLLMLLCDAVITVTSSVGMHALFYRRPLIALGQSYMTPFADARDVAAVDEVISNGWNPVRDHALYWLFSRYYVDFKSVRDGGWFEAFCRSIDHQASSPLQPIYALDELNRIYLEGDKPLLDGVVMDAALAETKPSEPTPALNAEPVIRAIAFHLPQFHAIPENDEWWGKGFTEWTNVRQGQPLFDGHYQPRVPSELGYYDLSEVQTLERQAELAREHGVEGFCFYYYWFDGKRLLERPVDQLLQHPEIDLPFCLCWANENWTRRWDGGEQEILMRQSYSADLDERFALDALPYLRDSRYIRVNGKPLFMVYRLDIIPNVARAVAAWREVWRREGLGEVYLVAVESFKAIAPDVSGFDATCEFLPHQVNFGRFTPDVPLQGASDVAINVADYAKLADYWVDRERPDYKRFRGLVPSWDNAARRRKGGATMLHGASPELYERWLRRTAARTLEELSGDERIIFINAWNEWGEGCYLEPDQRYGRAYLEATRRVLGSPEIELSAELARERSEGKGLTSAMWSWLGTRIPDAQGQQLLADALAGGEREPLRVAVGIVERGQGKDAVARTLESLRRAEHASLRGPAFVLSSIDGAVAGSDEWIRVPHGGMAEAVNTRLGEGGFDWLLLVEAGCEFTVAGLRTVQVDMRGAPGCRAVFADEAWRVPGARLAGAFRPDFNLDFVLSHPGAMARHWLFSREAVLAAGGFSNTVGNAFELDMILRFVEEGGFGGLGHVSEPLLLGPPPSRSHDEAVRRVLRQHLLRRGYEQAEVLDGPMGTWRARYNHAGQPLVSIIVPTRDNLPLLRQCVESLLEKTAYKQFEILIVDNDSRDPDAKAWLAGLEQMGLDQIRVLRYPQPFNYAAMNNLAARAARGDYLLLLNNDTAVIEPDWLDEMLNHGQRPEVGIVGAKLLYPNGKVQHAGVVLGLRGPAEHPAIGAGADDPGYMGRLLADQDYSAVTAACLLIRKSLFEAVEGFDEANFAVSYNDVDLCLKVVESGHLVVWTPHARVMHIGSVSQKLLDPKAQQAKRERFGHEQDTFYSKWLPRLAHDAAYNRNLSLTGIGFEPDTRTRLAGAPASRFSAAPLVLAANADLTGSGHYRIIQPFAAMREAGLLRGVCESILPLPAEVERLRPAAIVLQRPIRDDYREAIQRVRKHSDAKLVFELDDNVLAVPRKSVHHRELKQELERRLRAALKLVDRFVVSTQALKETFAGFHPDIRVVENRLPAEWWKNIQKSRRDGGRPRVGWAGGVGHDGDLEMIAEVVRELAGEVDWVFLGMCPKSLLPHVKEYYLGIETPQYPKRLASLGLDLAIAPLEDNAFNACKSTLRLLEYGACGYPVVCSDVRPYREHGLPVTRVRNRARDWVDAIREQLVDRDDLARRGVVLQELMRERWMLEGEALEVWKRAWLDR